VQLEATAAGDLTRRLRRIEGQVRGIIKMIEDGRECADIITQLAAASRALDRAGFRLLSSSLRQCLAASANGEDEQMSSEDMEKLFLSLA
jgi:DNA-binding FrmR family transcriptional regulator